MRSDRDREGQGREVLQFCAQGSWEEGVSAGLRPGSPDLGGGSWQGRPVAGALTVVPAGAGSGEAGPAGLGPAALDPFRVWQLELLGTWPWGDVGRGVVALSARAQ